MTELIKLFTNESLTVKIIMGVIFLYFNSKWFVRLPFMPKKRSHGNCSLYPDMKEIIAVAVDKCRRIVVIEEKTTIRDQMRFLDVVQKAIIIRMLDVFRSFNPTHKEIRDYKRIVKLAGIENSKTIKAWFKDNGYAKKSGEGWAAYKKDKVELAISQVSESLSDEFIGFSITREELKQKHLIELVPYAVEMYNKAFDKAREISIEKESEIESINNEGKSEAI